VEDSEMGSRDAVVNRYLSYLDACNRRAWEELSGYLAESILVNSTSRTQDEYLADVAATTDTFPDYQWRLVPAVVEGE
jgi:predicted ester cyclase